jgi:hypothetical protein
MTNLQQAVYEDDNGHEFPAEKVDALAPYTHQSDGFYNWTCGICSCENSDRWWNISGRVVMCEHCRKMNLLVRTNCTEITELVKQKYASDEREVELKRLKDIEKWNDDKFTRIKSEVLSLVERAIASHPERERKY